MKKKNIKYKFTGIIVIVLIVLVIAGCFFVNFWYLEKPEVVEEMQVDLKISESDVEAIQSVKTNLIEDENYKSLVPIEMPKDFQVAPTGKTNPFDTNLNEQG
jgi:uncharacterized protein YpmB